MALHQFALADTGNEDLLPCHLLSPVEPGMVGTPGRLSLLESSLQRLFRSAIQISFFHVSPDCEGGKKKKRMLYSVMPTAVTMVFSFECLFFKKTKHI